MEATQETAERLEWLRGISDAVMDLWPSQSREDTAVDDPELTAKMTEFNEAMQQGHGGSLARLLTENVAYRLLIDQEVERLPEGNLSFGYACSTTPYFASLALSWVASAARGDNDYLFATMMMSFKSEYLIEAIKALLDAGSALRDGIATITMTPPDELEETSDEITTVDVTGTTTPTGE